MERETRIIKAPISGVEVVINAWITGREKREITSVYTKDFKFKTDTQKTEANLTGDKITEAQNKTIEMFVVDVKDGDSEKNNLDKILDMRSEDYEFIMKEIDKSVIPEEEKKE